MAETEEYRHFELDRHPDVVVCRLNGPRLLDRERFPYFELNEELTRMLAEHPTHDVVLDFARVEAIDTLAVQALVGLWKRLKSRGNTLAVCGLSGIPLQILRMVRFELLFGFHETPAEAIAALKSG